MKPSRFTRRTIAVAGATITGLAAIVVVASPALAATNYYVATNGNDNNNGTSLSTPFRTIQKCATVAVAGDTCLIRSGTYRETVTPTNSGTSSARITFANYNGESVTVSGADAVTTGWTQHSGNIYYTNVTLPVSNETSDVNGVAQAEAVQANQVFVNASMALEARWPNGSTDASHPATSVADANTTELVVYDSDLPSGVDFTGAIQHLVNTRGWTATSNIVSSNSAGVLNLIRRCGSGTGNCNGVGTKYYLTGGNNGLQLLDSAGEWWYDWTNQRLYLWVPTGGSPASQTVEYKKRFTAFDLGGRDYVTIYGLKIFAATILADASSDNHIIDSITANYVSHSITQSWDPEDTSGCYIWCSHATDTGIQLRGTGHVLKNSVLAWSPGNLVNIDGTGITVTNNLIHNGAYLGGYATPVRIAETAVGTVTFNTIHTSGRFLVDIAGGTKPGASRIAYNHLYDYGRQTRDLGAIYACCGFDGMGTRMDHNWIHGNQVWDKYGTGIFLDDSAFNFKVDHNVLWDDGTFGTKMNASGGDGTSFDNLWHNNTYAPGHGFSDGGTITDGTGSEFRNNAWAHGSAIFEKTQTNVTVTNNSSNRVRPKYVNTTVNDFRLQSGSPLIDAGAVISGVTDGYVGSAPDQGAYEYGAPDWIVGCGLADCRATTTAYQGIQAASYSSQAGTSLENASTGGRDVAYIHRNDWTAYPGLDLSTGITTLTLQVASPRAVPGTVEARLGSTTGTLLGTCTVPNTGGWQTWTTVSCPVSGTSSSNATIYLVFQHPTSTGTLFNVNWLRFSAPALTTLDPYAMQQAEQYDAQAGTELEAGGTIADVSWIGNNDWTAYSNMTFGGTSPTTLSVRTASTNSGASPTIEVRLGSTTGTLVATCPVTYTGGWQVWTTQTCSVSGATGTQTVYFVFKAGGFNFDQFQFS